MKKSRNCVFRLCAVRFGQFSSTSDEEDKTQTKLKQINISDAPPSYLLLYVCGIIIIKFLSYFPFWFVDIHFFSHSNHFRQLNCRLHQIQFDKCAHIYSVYQINTYAHQRTERSKLTQEVHYHLNTHTTPCFGYVLCYLGMKQWFLVIDGCSAIYGIQFEFQMSSNWS